MPLSMGDAAMQQLYEFEWVCESAEHVVEAAFWRVQREMFVARRAQYDEKYAASEEEEEEEGPERAGGGGAAGGR